MPCVDGEGGLTEASEGGLTHGWDFTDTSKMWDMYVIVKRGIRGTFSGTEGAHVSSVCRGSATARW